MNSLLYPLTFNLIAIIFLAVSANALGADRYVGSNGADYFAMPSEDSMLEGIMSAGQPLTTLSTRGEWIYVASSDESQVGWVLKSDTSVSKPELSVVKTNIQGPTADDLRVESEKVGAEPVDRYGLIAGIVLFFFGLGLLTAGSIGARIFGIFLMFLGFGSCAA